MSPTRSSRGLSTPVLHKLSIHSSGKQAGLWHGRSTVDQTVLLTQNIENSFEANKTYLRAKLDWSLTFRHHLETLSKKLATSVTLLRRLAGSGWGAVAKTLRTAASSLVYSTAEYCAPVWCCSAHTRHIDSVLNDALRIVTGYLCPTPTDYLPILSGIQPAELRSLGATLSLARRGTLDPDHILLGQPAGLPDLPQERLKSRRPFAPASRKLLMIYLN